MFEAMFAGALVKNEPRVRTLSSDAGALPPSHSEATTPEPGPAHVHVGPGVKSAGGHSNSQESGLPGLGPCWHSPSMQQRSASLNAQSV